MEEAGRARENGESLLAILCAGFMCVAVQEGSQAVLKLE
jgi:hypothetical protein